MRVFRVSYRDKNGKTKKVSKWWIELRDHLQTVRRFPAFRDKAQSELLGRQIERLVNYKVAGEQPDPKLSRWLEQISDKLRDRFVKIGLIDATKAAAGKLLTDHIEDFKQSLLVRGSGLNHAQQAERKIRRIIEGCKFQTWTDISASKVERFLASLREKEHGINSITSNCYLQAMKQFCRWMIQDRRASESPIEYLRGLGTQTDRRHDRRALEIDEIRRLLETTRAAPKRFGLIGYERFVLYRIAIETGLRRNELKSLTVSSFDLKNCTVTVKAVDAKNRRESTLPIRKDTAAMLRDFLAGKMPNVKAFNKITRHTSEMFRADLADAGIPYVDDAGRYCDFHSLRHTTGSLLAASGVHPKVAQSIMRHSDINLTMSRYTHIFKGQESEAVAGLPDLSLPSREQQQAVRTGTDDLAENSHTMDGKPCTPVDANGQTNLNNGSKTPISTVSAEVESPENLLQYANPFRYCTA